MPKIRTLKAEFFRDEDISHNLVTKTLAAGLICCMADDEGRFKASIGAIRGEVFTHDSVTDEEVADALAHLESTGFVRVYSAAGRRFGVILNWKRHQPVPPSRFTPSNLPPAPPQADRKRTASKAQADHKHGPAPQQADASTLRARAPGKEREGERNRNTPPTPPPAPGDKATVILAGFLEASNKSTYSAIDAVRAQDYATDFQRVSGEVIADWLREHAEWMASQGKRPYGKLEYYAEYLALKYGKAADNGAGPARASPPGGGGLTHISSVSLAEPSDG